ncbi:aminotransferase class V-fold PLP-dependent enzyme [Rurimicrobium arvi]
MSNRRIFLKQTLMAAGAMALPDLSKANNPAPLPEQNDSEQYWRDIRAQFPLKRELVYLNNGTLGPSPYTVLRTVEQHMLYVEESAFHGSGEQELCTALARFVHCRESEITLTHNVTEGINIVCWGLDLKAGDEVIITDNEHAGSASPWLNRARLSGIKLVVVKLGRTAEEMIGNIRNEVTRKTKVLSIPHIPCTNGQILPIKEICRFARERNIFTLIDGAHPPGMLPVNIEQLDCDAYASCGHKWLLGPKGTGFLYVNEKSRDHVQAYYGGAGVDAGWDLLSAPPLLNGYASDGHRFYYGSQNMSLYKGLISAIQFQEAIGKERIEQRIKSLAKYLQEQLLLLGPDMDMLTPEESASRGAQIAFRLRNIDLQHFNNYCRERKIVTRFVPENNICCLRVSCHIYNSFEEIDQFLLMLDQYVHARS